MNAIEGTVKNGQLVLDNRTKLPDGTRVEVLPVGRTRSSPGMREEEWPTTPDGIAALVARMDQVETGWLSPEDDASWRAALGVAPMLTVFRKHGRDRSNSRQSRRFR